MRVTELKGLALEHQLSLEANLTWAQAHRGWAEDLVDHAESLVAHARAGAPASLQAMQAVLGAILLLSGRAGDAVAPLECSVVGALPARASAAVRRLYLAEAYRQVGRVEDARRTLQGVRAMGSGALHASAAAEQLESLR